MPPTLPLIAAEIWAAVRFCKPVGVWQLKQLVMNRFLSLVDIGVSAGASIVMESALVTAVDFESATLAVKLKEPEAVGVPVMEPAEVNPIPAGRDPL